jgi:predicted heme/steroid binding protein/uncharacterized membrane protein
MESMDREKLKANDGQESKPTFIAFEGKVYDVSESAKWKNGKHMMRHTAGQDLTAEMKAAPHGPEVFEKFSQVADLSAAPAEDEDGPRIPWPLSWLWSTFPILKRHSHPVSVHFPIAFLMGSLLFCLLYLVTGNQFMEATCFYLLVLGTVTAPFAILTGLQSWWLYYGLKRNGGLTVKLVGAPLMMVAGGVGSLLRLSNPDILIAGGSASYLYIALVAVCTPIALTVGYIGGQMVFPD